MAVGEGCLAWIENAGQRSKTVLTCMHVDHKVVGKKQSFFEQVFDPSQ